MAFGDINGTQWEATLLPFSTLSFCALLISHVYLYMSLYVTIAERLCVI